MEPQQNDAGAEGVACSPGQQSRSSFTLERMVKVVEVNYKRDKIQHQFIKDRSSQTNVVSVA